MKKLFTILLATILLLSLLAGCQETDTTEDGRVTIEFWHSMGSTTGELVQAIVDDFNNSQDEVYVECIYQGDYTTAGTKIQAAIAAGTAPNVVQTELTRIGMYAAAGVLMDLTPYAEADENFNADDFYPALMDYSYYEGKLISLPNGRSIPVLYYNVDAFKEAGLESAPTTWDEMESYAEILTGDGVYGYGCPIGDSWYYLQMVITAGGQIYNEEGNNIGFYGESGIAPLALWSRMKANGTLYIPDGDDYASNSALRNAFMSGICCMTMQSCAQYKALVDNSDFEVGVSYVPILNTSATITGGSNLIAFDGMSDEEADATWKFLSYMCSAEVAGRYAAGTGYVPTTEAARNSEIYQEMLEQYPYLDMPVSQLNTVTLMPFDESYTEIKDNVIGKYTQECLINGMTPEEAVEKMYEETGAFYQ